MILNGPVEAAVRTFRKASYFFALETDGVLWNLKGLPLCANIVETPSYPFISEQGGKDDSLCW